MVQLQFTRVFTGSEFTTSAIQSQKTASAYFTSKQMLPFGFAEQNYRNDDGQQRVLHHMTTQVLDTWLACCCTTLLRKTSDFPVNKGENLECLFHVDYSTSYIQNEF